MAGRHPYDSEGALARNSPPHTYGHGLNLSVSISVCGFLLLVLAVAGGPSCLDSFLFSSVSRLLAASFLYCCCLTCAGPLDLGPVRVTVGLGPAPRGENKSRGERGRGTGGGATTGGGEGHKNTSTKICMYVSRHDNTSTYICSCTRKRAHTQCMQVAFIYSIPGLPTGNNVLQR